VTRSKLECSNGNLLSCGGAFMRIPFDLRTVSRIPLTRMSGSVPARVSPVYRRLKAWLARALLITLGFCCAQLFAAVPLVQKHENRHEIDQLEDAWRNAILTSDVKTLSSLLADDYMAITASGTLQSREETLENLRTGRIHFTSLNITDRRVRFYGTAAVVTSLAHIEADTPDGQVAGCYRYTRVYVRNAEGAWKIVSFEASRIRESGMHKRNEFH
jgi:ketosteroid isomerase-like protein